MFKNYSLLLVALLTGLSLSGQIGVGINTTNPKSTLDVNGSIGGRVTTITSNTTLDTSHFIVICDNTTDITLTLPSAALSGGRIYFIKRINVGNVSINPNGSDSIDDTTAWMQLYRFQLTTLVGEGSTKWMVVNDGIPSSGGSGGMALTSSDRYDVSTETSAVMLSNFANATLDSLKIDVDTATSAYAGLLTPEEKLRINQNYDSDSTNERITSFTLSNDSLIIAEADIPFSVKLSDNDSMNERIDSVILRNDSLYIYEANSTFAVALIDADTTNETIDSILYENDTLYVYEGDTVFKTSIASTKWNPADSIGDNGYIYAIEALSNGDTAVITDNAALGLGTSTPTEKIDINGTIRLRDVDTSRTSSDTLLVIDVNGVVKKRASVKSVMQVTNTLSTNINGTGNTTFNWINTSSTTHVTNDSSSFTVATDGVTVNKSGIFKVSVFQYQEGSSNSRNNAAVRFTINGTVQAGFGANAYQRRSSNHNESTAGFVKVMNITSGQKIGIRNDRLAGTGSVTCPAGTLVFIIEEL